MATAQRGSPAPEIHHLRPVTTYPLPSRATELDLTDAIREHAILAVPRFVLCAETCRGFCPRCGVNLNTGTCECEPEGMDERWAALKRLAQDR